MESSSMLSPDFIISTIHSYPPPATNSFTTGLLQSTPSGAAFNPFFRFSSSGFIGTARNPLWAYLPAVDWTNRQLRSYLPDIRDQETCGESVTAPLIAWGWCTIDSRTLRATATS